MDNNSSGEDLVIKTRKPYTITKQRERWTEEEHNRFLEALKLFGRTWQRFEEHIGTKTAVQIRSHAQKFFTKLEKEAFVKGVPLGQALDIEIPPPRPKRKPSNPYPRKIGFVAPIPQVGVKDGKKLLLASFCTDKQILDLEREPLPEKPSGDEKPGNEKDNWDGVNCSEVVTFFQEVHCTSLSSANKDSMPTPMAARNSCTSGEFVPMMVHNENKTNESYLTVEHKGNQKFVGLDTKQMVQDNGTNNISNFANSHEKMVEGQKTNEMSHPENFGALPSIDLQATQNYPRHVPVHVLNGTPGTVTQDVSPDMSYQESACHQIGGIDGHPNLFTNLASSATTEHHISASSSSIHQSFPHFHPLFTPIHNNHNDYQPYLHVSSTFSSLILSTLLQNPASHAAASFAATFWPCANLEASADSPLGTLGGFPTRQINPAPSMAAIAAATIAAATAWWASHGLLLMCTPFHTGSTCTPESTTAKMADAIGLAATDNNGKRERAARDQNQQLDPEYSEAIQEQHSASKPPTLSLSDSEESEGAKPNAGVTAAKQGNTAAPTELHDSNKTKDRKQVDHSSCGSNTPSSSEVETDALEKQKNDKDKPEELDVSHPASDSNNRRGKSSSSTNDSWKEVSEEGKLAFQALFSRQVLPQSFSPPHALKNKGYQKKNIEKDKQTTHENAEGESQFDLNIGARGTYFSHQPVENNTFLRGGNNGKGLLRMELGSGKLKSCRTGFKPYKRCSVEATESKVPSASSHGEEKGPKRIRLEGEAST